MESALRGCFGIGPWTIDYLAMRGLRWPDAFPSTDLVLARALQAHASAATPTSTNGSRAIDDLTSIWRPWRAYAAMHLLEERAAARANEDNDQDQSNARNHATISRAPRPHTARRDHMKVERRP
jgi:3-methyladenine DNA glycosylase/8-oxoguanine DNA glycosylase